MQPFVKKVRKKEESEVLLFVSSSASLNHVAAKGAKN